MQSPQVREIRVQPVSATASDAYRAGLNGKALPTWAVGRRSLERAYDSGQVQNHLDMLATRRYVAKDGVWARVS